MTEDRHETEAAATRKDKRGPIVAGPDAREVEKPARSDKSAAELPGKSSQEATTVTPAREKDKRPTHRP